jgi:hypothetical protein
MKTRTKWLLVLGVASGLALMVLVPKVGAAVCVGALAALAWIARKARAISGLIRAEAGTVEGQGDHFEPVADAPDLLDVWAASEDPAVARRVQLPEGIKAEDVRAVVIIPSGRATVELLP